MMVESAHNLMNSAWAAGRFVAGVLTTIEKFLMVISSPFRAFFMMPACQMALMFFITVFVIVVMVLVGDFMVYLFIQEGGHLVSEAKGYWNNPIAAICRFFGLRGTLSTIFRSALTVPKAVQQVEPLKLHEGTLEQMEVLQRMSIAMLPGISALSAYQISISIRAHDIRFSGLEHAEPMSGEMHTYARYVE